MGQHALEPPAGKVARRRDVAVRPPPLRQPSTKGRADPTGSTPEIAAQQADANGTLSAKHVLALQRAAGNSAVSGALQRDGTASTKPRAKINLDLGWLDLSGGGIQTNEQLAAVARLAISSLESDLTDVESDQVRNDVKEWIAAIQASLPYFDRHGAEQIDASMVPLVNHQIDRLTAIRREVQIDKNTQLADALRAELRAAEKAAAEVEAMQPTLDDAMRAAFRKGDSGTVKDAVSTVKSALSIGRNIRSLAASITTDLLGLPVPSGTKMMVDTWSSQIGRVNVTIVNVGKYTAMLGTLGRGLATINIALTIGDRSKRATEVEQGMKDLNDVVNVSTDLASLPAVGLPPHMSLMTTLYIKPALKVITKQISVLVERLSDVNQISVAVTGDLMYPGAEPGGQAMFDFMVAVMPATDQSEVPAIPGAVASYLYDHRDKLEAGVEEEVPTSGWWLWKDLDSTRARSWVFLHRKQVWAMFYGSMQVPNRRVR